MRRSLALAAVLALAACSTKHTTFTGSLKLGATAEANYQAGVDELKAKNHAEATRFFEYVKTKYPFSKYSPLAELRLADIKFGQDRYVEAADAYQQFVQLHPTHEEVDYAEFRAGLSYCKDAPGEFALFPPAAEKDQRQAEKAVADAAPTSCRPGRLEVPPRGEEGAGEADGGWPRASGTSAEYYFKRARWAGAAGRYETLVDVPGLQPRGRGALEARAGLRSSSTRSTGPARRSSS